MRAEEPSKEHITHTYSHAGTQTFIDTVCKMQKKTKMKRKQKKKKRSTTCTQKSFTTLSPLPLDPSPNHPCSPFTVNRVEPYTETPTLYISQENKRVTNQSVGPTKRAFCRRCGFRSLYLNRAPGPRNDVFPAFTDDSLLRTKITVYRLNSNTIPVKFSSVELARVRPCHFSDVAIGLSRVLLFRST